MNECFHLVSLYIWTNKHILRLKSEIVNPSSGKKNDANQKQIEDSQRQRFYDDLKENLQQGRITEQLNQIEAHMDQRKLEMPRPYTN